MPIRTLPPLLVNQIAAGEVIERPASVVKELIENSLDAGATRIDVAVEQGGAQLIRISDNGRGITPDELPLAVAPHATSKLVSAEQLAAIETFGFRGEALASIASVSRLRLTSRAADEPAGAMIEVSGDRFGQAQPAAASPGTIVEIRDLFFNTPARRKFLRAPQTEFGHIVDAVERIALVHPSVGFRLTHNDRPTRELPPATSQAERCRDILGRELTDALLECERVEPPDRGGARVWAMIGPPSLARSNSRAQHLCVNGRPVRDRNLAHAIKEAYRGLMPPDRFPLAAVLLWINPAEVDVNVHPAKAEVRFRNPAAAHGLVLATLRQRLLGSDLTTAASFPTPQTRPAVSTPSLEPERSPSSIDDRPSPITDTSAFVDYFRRMDPTQKSFAFRQVREALAEEAPDQLPDAGLRNTAEHDPATVAPANGHDASPLRRRDILQVHQSYVVTQDEEGLLIVDQHALHERVMFEQLRRRLLGDTDAPPKPLESQRLLVPETLRAGPARQALAEELRPLLERIGVECEPIGPDTLAIHAFPTFLFDRHVEPAAFVEELLEKAESGDIDTGSLRPDGSSHVEEAVLHEVLDMMACKAAVKAGDRMSESELADLLARRDEIERASNCPHGRPTTLRLSLKDLARQFGRT